MLNQPLITLSEARRPRNELTLSPTYYAMVDDWINQLGYDGYCLHMKLQTMVDRRQERYADNHVPMPIQSLCDNLGISKKVWYKVAKLYYEFGLIDFIVYEDSASEGTKPINVIVYPYPQGNAVNGMKPLEKLRDWEDYKKAASGSQGKGGRPKKTVDPVPTENTNERSGGVSVGKQGGVSVGKHNNISKDINNSSKDSFVNKKVDKPEVKPAEETFEKIEDRNETIDDIFRKKVIESSFRHYADTREKYGYSKQGFLVLVNAFVDETIRDGRHMTINNLDSYIDGFFRNLSGHKQYRNEILSGQVNAAVTDVQDKSVQKQAPAMDVPTDDEIENLLRDLSV